MPTPNNVTPNKYLHSDPHPMMTKDHPHQRPGKWFAVVEINANPYATAQEVRDSICDALEVNLAEGVDHCLEGVSVNVDRRWGLHPDEGSDEYTIYWP
jgi:hypothetical protein